MLSRNLRSHRVATVLILLLVALVVVGAKVGKGGKKMHLGVPPSMVVNVSTFSVPNNNSGGSLFFYDRDSDSPFSVPAGYSFVVTDIFVTPPSLNPASDYLVVIGLEAGETRTFIVSADEPSGRQVSFNGAMIIPSGTPSARNTTSSSTACEVRMLGYFVKADALNGGESPFSEP